MRRVTSRKNHLQTLLNDTIIDVLGVIRSDASFAKLISTLQRNQFVFELPNDADLISPLVGLLMQVIPGMELISGNELVRVGVALEHALVNAMYRGNLELGPSVTPPHRAIVYDGATSDLIEKRKVTEPFKERRVYVDACAGKDEIKIVVRDDGKGFDTAKVPDGGRPEVARFRFGPGAGPDGQLHGRVEVQRVRQRSDHDQTLQRFLTIDSLFSLVSVVTGHV